MPRDEPISSFIGFHGANSKMIGLSDQFQQLKTDLMRDILNQTYAHILYGMAGLGKTTLAMQIYQDAEIQSKFEYRAWVTIGRVPQSTDEIARGIRAQLFGDHCLRTIPEGKNCLIVFDDVWGSHIPGKCLPFTESGSCRVLLIGRHRIWVSNCFGIACS